MDWKKIGEELVTHGLKLTLAGLLGLIGVALLAKWPAARDWLSEELWAPRWAYILAAIGAGVLVWQVVRSWRREPVTAAIKLVKPEPPKVADNFVLDLVRAQILYGLYKNHPNGMSVKAFVNTGLIGTWPVVERELERLASAGLVQLYRSEYSLTPAGRDYCIDFMKPIMQLMESGPLC